MILAVPLFLPVNHGTGNCYQFNHGFLFAGRCWEYAWPATNHRQKRNFSFFHGTGICWLVDSSICKSNLQLPFFTWASSRTDRREKPMRKNAFCNGSILFRFGWYRPLERMHNKKWTYEVTLKYYKCLIYNIMKAKSSDFGLFWRKCTGCWGLNFII